MLPLVQMPGWGAAAGARGREGDSEGRVTPLNALHEEEGLEFRVR